MGNTPVCQVTGAGIVRPTYENVLGYVQSAYRGIYGQDVYLGADSQDGQFMALLANAIHDCNGQTVAAYNAFSPTTAVGAGLSSIVKINGIRRKRATFSTCDFTCVGQAGAVIQSPIVRDADGFSWTLPDFVIPASGQISVTGTCQTAGAVALRTAAVDTASGRGRIATPQFGWQDVFNPGPAALGQPVESDNALRQRQALSTTLPSQSLFEGLYSALLAVTGVGRCRGYENDQNFPDQNGLPGHTLCFVVEGGDASVIALLIQRKKGNAGTFGSTIRPVTDAAGVTRQIAFSRPKPVAINYAMTIRSLGSYTSKTDLDLRTALADWTNARGIGNGIYRDQALVPAKFNGAAEAMGYEILTETFAISRDGNSPTAQDIVIAYDELPVCTPDSIVTSVIP